MKETTITINKDEMISVDNAKIVYKNFEGRAGKYNREGDRNFSLIIPTEEIAEDLRSYGWNIKRKEYEDGTTRLTLPVKVKFNERGPKIHLIIGKKRILLTEETAHRIDRLDIGNIDLDIRPYDWTVNDARGRSAYLFAMEITQNLDRFEERYSQDECPEEVPF